MFVFDFSNAVDGPFYVSVNPEGWNGPITVEYILAQAHIYDTQMSIIWRVKGTTHCFTIYENKLNILSSGKYEKHFEEALKNFRLDYLSWFREKEYADVKWKWEYEQQFRKFIKPEKISNNESKSN